MESIPDIPCIGGVAFDLDGTLFNTEIVYDVVCEKLLERRGHKVRPDVISQMMGRPSHIALQILINEHGFDDTVEALQTESHDLFLELINGRAELMPGAMEMIDHVQSLGLPISITTSSDPKLVTPLLDLANITSKFEFLLTAADVKNHKPHPEIYLTAAKKFGIQPAELLAFEDSQVGCAAAVASGAYTIVVPSKLKDQHDFSGASLIADSLKSPEIRRLVDLGTRGQ